MENSFSWLALACLSTLGYLVLQCAADPTVTQVCAGFGSCVFVKSDGSLWGMGDNMQGQLGLGFTLTETSLPVEIVTSNVAAVAAGEYHTLFVESNGSLWAMGYNGEGELGDGTTTLHAFPEQIVSNTVTRVAAGRSHSLFTTLSTGRFGSSGTLSAMGWNALGQLGDGTTNNRITPEVIYGWGAFSLPGPGIATIAGGDYHSLYVREDGSLWATGGNGQGQLGDGTTTEHNSYEEILTNNVTAVSAGAEHSLFIESDGSLWAMGDDSEGELGNNSTDDQLTPEEVGINVTTISAGFFFSCYIESNGSLWGMGNNAEGQLGAAGSIQYHAVQIVPSNVVAVTAGRFSTYFIKSDGSLW